MQFCNQAVMLRLAVCPGVLHGYAVFADRPGVHLESTWRSLGVHLEATWRAFGGHLKVTWRPLGGHLEATWSPSWPKRRQVALGVWLGALKCGPRGVEGAPKRGTEALWRGTEPPRCNFNPGSLKKPRRPSPTHCIDMYIYIYIYNLGGTRLMLCGGQEIIGNL